MVRTPAEVGGSDQRASRRGGGRCDRRRRWAEPGARLRVVVKKPGADLDEDTIASTYAIILPATKVPREVIFLDELPRKPHRQGPQRELRKP